MRNNAPHNFHLQFNFNLSSNGCTSWANIGSFEFSIINQKFSFTWNECLTIKTYIHFAYYSPTYNILSTFFSKIRCFAMDTIVFSSVFTFTCDLTFIESKLNNLFCIFCKPDSNKFQSSFPITWSTAWYHIKNSTCLKNHKIY